MWRAKPLSTTCLRKQIALYRLFITLRCVSAETGYADSIWHTRLRRYILNTLYKYCDFWLPIDLNNYQCTKFTADGLLHDEYLKGYLLLLLTLVTNLEDIQFYCIKPTYRCGTSEHSISGRLCIQSSLLVFARSLKRWCYQQMTKDWCKLSNSFTHG